MRYELRRRLAILIAYLPAMGLHDDAHALRRHVALGDVVPWLLVSDWGREVLASIAGGLDVAEHLTHPRTEPGRNVRLVRDALGELNALLEEERQDLERAA
jgi:hypothetical protein